MKRKLLWFLAVVALVGAAAWITLSYLRRPEETPAMRGRELAHELGCFACHGPDGTGGVADPTAPGGEIPDWSYATTKLFVNSEQDIRDWILDGAPQRELELRPKRGSEPIVPMPAYRDLLSDSELDDLVAYYLAVSGWAPDIPDDAFEGRRIATRLGCFGCHGPSGMGGVPNPGSFKGHIPAWDGEEFRDLVRNDDELREWILEGKIERLWDNPLARRFLEGQKTPMPAYHDLLSDAELEKIVAYIHWLRPEKQPDQDTKRDADSVIGTIHLGLR